MIWAWLGGSPHIRVHKIQDTLCIMDSCPKSNHFLFSANEMFTEILRLTKLNSFNNPFLMRNFNDFSLACPKWICHSLTVYEFSSPPIAVAIVRTTVFFPPTLHYHKQIKDNLHNLIFFSYFKPFRFNSTIPSYIRLFFILDGQRPSFKGNWSILMLQARDLIVHHHTR